MLSDCVELPVVFKESDALRLDVVPLVESIASQEHRYTRTRFTRRAQRPTLLIIILEMVDRFCQIKAT